MQLVSPDGSKQSFPQRALYQGSISPSTPTQTTSINNSCSGFKNSMPFKHRDLVMGGTTLIKHMEGCKPATILISSQASTPKVSAAKHHPQVVFEIAPKPQQ